MTTVIPNPAIIIKNRLAEVRLSDVGAKTHAQDAAYDAAPAFAQACQQAMAIGGKVVIPPTPNTKYVFRSLQQFNVTSELIIESNGATIEINHAGSDTISMTAEPVAGVTFAQATATAGDYTITVNNGSLIQPGDTIRISSPIVWAQIWNYTKFEVHRVESVAGNVVTLSTPLLFGYDTTAGTPDVVTLSVSRYRSVIWSSETLVTVPAGINARWMTLFGMGRAEIQGIRWQDPNHRLASGPDGLMLSGCLSPVVADMSLEGGRYGIHISNGTRGAKLENIDSFKCYHPIDPNTAAIGTHIRGLRGYKNLATVNSHPAFDVTFQDVVCEEADGMNFRTVGGALKNVNVLSSKVWGDVEYQDIDFTANAGVTDRYPDFSVLYQNTSIACPNNSTTDYPELGNKANQNMRVEGCTLPRVTTDGAGTAKVEIVGGTLNYVLARGSECIIKGTDFINPFPNLHPNQTSGVAINPSNCGRLVVQGGNVVGFPYVFLQSASNRIVSQGQTLRNISTDLFHPSSTSNASYIFAMQGATFDNCTLPMNSPALQDLRVSGNMAIGGTVDASLTA